jgi:hypothetical protein
MERRWSDRRAVTWSARVCLGQDAGTASPISDVSLEGMFIESAKDLPVAPGADIKVSFVLPERRGGDRQYSLLCRVVHRRAGGLGVHFLEFHRDLFCELEEMLYAYPGNAELHGVPGSAESPAPASQAWLTGL